MIRMNLKWFYQLFELLEDEAIDSSPDEDPAEWWDPPPEGEEHEDALVTSDIEARDESVDIEMSRCSGSANSSSGLSGFPSGEIPAATAAKVAIANTCPVTASEVSTVLDCWPWGWLSGWFRGITSCFLKFNSKNNNEPLNYTYTDNDANWSSNLP